MTRELFCRSVPQKPSVCAGKDFDCQCVLAFFQFKIHRMIIRREAFASVARWIDAAGGIELFAIAVEGEIPLGGEAESDGSGAVAFDFRHQHDAAAVFVFRHQREAVDFSVDGGYFDRADFGFLPAVRGIEPLFRNDCRCFTVDGGIDESGPFVSGDRAGFHFRERHVAD